MHVGGGRAILRLFPLQTSPMSIPTPRWFEDEQLIALILPGALLGTLGLGEGFVALDWMTRGGTGQHALLLVGVVVTFGVGYPWMMRRWRCFEEARETARMTILRSLETDHLEELLDRPSLTRDEKRLVLYILGNERPGWIGAWQTKHRPEPFIPKESKKPSWATPEKHYHDK